MIYIYIYSIYKIEVSSSTHSLPWNLRRHSSAQMSLGSLDLAALLHPVTPEEFRRHFFEQDALHVARPRQGGSGVFGMERVRESSGKHRKS